MSKKSSSSSSGGIGPVNEAKGTATDKDKYIRELENEHSAKLATAVAALELIAAPMRPDGTWNRDRAACQMLAQLTLGVFEA